MTLSKQLILLVTAIFLMIFGGNLYISIQNIKSYLQEESKVHAQDTATSLGLSLSPYIGDETDPMLETMINSIFDMGYYREIRLENPDGKVLVQKTNPATFKVVPDWFVNALPIETAIAEREISAGWMIGGTVFVTANPGYAYLKLYSQAKSGLWYSLAAFAGSMAFLLLFLRFILMPLKRIEQLANKIASGRFETIAKLPWTTEIKNVAVAMNGMSTKIEGVIRKLNASLEEMNTKLHVDELTGLAVKGTFETDMKSLFISRGNGYIFTLRIDDLGGFAKQAGNEKVDAFLTGFAKALTDAAEATDQENVTAYRFFGSEFALIARNLSYDGATVLAKTLQAAFNGLSQQYDKPDVAHMGATPFNPIGTTPGILAAANEAYEKARHIGHNAFYVRDNDDLARDMDEWKELVFSIIAEERFDVNLIGPARTLTDDTLFMEEAFTQAYDKSGEPIPIGTFVSIAEKYDKVVELDQAVTSKVIKTIREKKIGHHITVNLSLHTITSIPFRKWLAVQLAANKDVAGQLAFSATAYGAAKDVEGFRHFIDFVHENGAKVILKRFEAQFIPLDHVKDFNLDFIRLARDYTDGIAKEGAKKKFVGAMQELGELLGVKIFAENVKSDADFAAVKEIGLYGASR